MIQIRSTDAPDSALAEQIDQLLPQTQCTRCGYAACRPYARALAAGETELNRCPPGGAAGITSLAKLLNQPVKALDPECGAEGPRLMVRIDAEHCIGCTKCIIACPVDAIIGGPKRMHTVLPELCTGCELCLPPCPVDCIVIEPLGPEHAWTTSDGAAARTRLARRNQRLERSKYDEQLRHGLEAQNTLAELTSSAVDRPADNQQHQRKLSVVEAAIERARVRQADRKAAQQSQDTGSNKQ